MIAFALMVGVGVAGVLAVYFGINADDIPPTWEQEIMHLQIWGERHPRAPEPEYFPHVGDKP